MQGYVKILHILPDSNVLLRRVQIRDIMTHHRLGVLKAPWSPNYLCVNLLRVVSVLASTLHKRCCTLHGSKQGILPGVEKCGSREVRAIFPP